MHKSGNLKLRAYVDYGWAKCHVTRKFVIGYCAFSRWFFDFVESKKHLTLSRSSTEAEYRSMASATCETIWISNLLGNIGIKDL